MTVGGVQLFVARVRCYHGWDEDPALRNKEVICYLTKEGKCTRAVRDAMLHESEAEAWNHLGTTGNIGSEGGQDWSWVEPAA